MLLHDIERVFRGVMAEPVEAQGYSFSIERVETIAGEAPNYLEFRLFVTWLEKGQQFHISVPVCERDLLVQECETAEALIAGVRRAARSLMLRHARGLS